MNVQNVVMTPEAVKAVIDRERQEHQRDGNGAFPLGKWPMWYLNGHQQEPESNGHVWKYFQGEWFDTVRKCTQCGVLHFHFRCWSGSSWIPSPNNLTGGYGVLARQTMPWIFEQFGHIPAGAVTPCNRRSNVPALATGAGASARGADSADHKEPAHG